MNELLKLINKGSEFSAFHSRGLFNHLPMALFALDQLGAEDKKITKFFDSYSKKLEPQNLSTNSPYTDSNWQEGFGDKQNFSKYIIFFESKIEELSKEQIFDKYISVLSTGLATGAFHPLIRLAYALEMDSKPEVVHSLAAWSASYFTFESNENEGNLSLEESLKALAAVAHFQSHKYKGYGVFSRLQQITKNENFNKHINSINYEGINLKTISELCLRLYLASDDNFTALHCVTASHAMRIVLPYVKNKNQVLQCFWQSISACYIDSGLPELDSIKLQDKTILSWDEILKKAIQSEDDHVFKFVYTCKSEFEVYGDNNYQIAASKKVI